LRDVSSMTGAPAAASRTAVTVLSGKSPSRTIPLTCAASALRAFATVSAPGDRTASVTRPRCAAAAISSAGELRSSRQLSDVPWSRTSERASPQGHRTGTQSAGFGAAAYRSGDSASARRQGLHILLIYDGRNFQAEWNEVHFVEQTISPML